jgi:hypothetical protein
MAQLRLVDHHCGVAHSATPADVWKVCVGRPTLRAERRNRLAIRAIDRRRTRTPSDYHQRMVAKKVGLSTRMAAKHREQ